MRAYLILDLRFEGAGRNGTLKTPAAAITNIFHVPIISGMLLPAFPRAFVKEAENTARLRATQMILAVERFRGMNKRLPEALKELVPQFVAAVAEDPFDGNPLGYKKISKGYLIYSVGSDREDNGGREKGEPPDNTPFDIVFSVRFEPVI